MGVLQGGTAQGNGSPPSPNHENGETMVLGPAVVSSPARETFIEMHAHESSRPSPLRYNAHAGTRHAHLPVRSSAAWIHPRDLTLCFSANLQARSRTQLRFSSSILTLTGPRPLQIAPVRAVDIPTLVRSRLSASRPSAPALSPILSTCQSELPGGQWANCPLCCSPNRANPACLLSLCGCWLAPTRQIFFFLVPFRRPASSPPTSSSSIWARDSCQGSLPEHWVRGRVWAQHGPRPAGFTIAL